MLNKLIASALPYMPKKLIWIFSKRYIAGETIEDGLNASRELNRQGVEVTVDLLGEFISTIEQAEENRNKYIEIIERFTCGKGADITFECSGAARAANDGLVLTRKGGQYTQIGLFGKPIQIDFEKICFRELKVTGSLGSTWTSWEKAIQLIAAGTVDTKILVSDIMPITEWEKAFHKFENKEGMKLVLTPVD